MWHERADFIPYIQCVLNIVIMSNITGHRELQQHRYNVVSTLETSKHHYINANPFVPDDLYPIHACKPFCSNLLQHGLKAWTKHKPYGTRGLIQTSYAQWVLILYLESANLFSCLHFDITCLLFKRSLPL